MFITITIQTNNHQADIRIDSEQKISQGLRVLYESGKLPPAHMPDFFRSSVKECLVSAHRTFGEEGIYDGDVLIVVE
ncbi:MAG: EsaB/YukD family protein [Defluviitaleaceae bacterium]|nr:EsaB/YukD family protein [Defluviitaleaceae bacterium]